MSDKKDREMLPSLTGKVTPKHLKQLGEIAVPANFHAPTDLAVTRKAYHEFECAENSGRTPVELYDAYWEAFDRSRQTKPELQKAAALKPIESPAALQAVLARNSLEEYRKERGLDKLREHLKQKLLEQLSFERGLENIVQHTKDHAGKVPQASRGPSLVANGSKVSEPARLVNGYYPDLTAEEVVWLSLAKIPAEWVYDTKRLVYYPPGLLDMDMDGLQFGLGTIDDRAESGVEATTPEQAAGVTGTSRQYQLLRFEHNVSQIIKAVILLSIDDSDVFKRIWDEQDASAWRRGDGIIVRRFLERQGKQVGDGNLCDLLKSGQVTRADVDDARLAFADYYRGLKVESPQIRNPMDFVKLIGLLGAAPGFVQRLEDFQGYVKPYGTGVDFIRQDGMIEESVPLHEHIIHSTAYGFHDHVHEANQRNEVMRELMAELQQQARMKVTEEGQMLASDVLQNHILGTYGVFVPTNVRAEDKEHTPTVMTFTKAVSERYVERTVKFSFHELRVIAKVFGDLPKGALRYVRSVRKELSDADTVHSMRSGMIRAGEYDTEKRRITISTPVKAPHAGNELDSMVRLLYGSKKNKSLIAHDVQDSAIAEDYFVHTLLHEVGESIYHHLEPNIKEQWERLGSISLEGHPRTTHLTPYSRTSVSEDFCEHFAIFYTHGRTFCQRGRKNPVLGAKYAFMRELWAGDDVKREFRVQDELGTSLEILHGNSEDDMESMNLEQRLRDVLADENELIKNERTRFARELISYEALETFIEEEEGTAQPYDRAARKYLKENGDAFSEAEREDESHRRIVEIVTLKTEKALRSAKVGCGLDMVDFQQHLYLGATEKAIEWAKANGAEENAAGAMVKQLVHLYDQFGYAFTILGKKEENDEFKERLLSLIRGLENPKEGRGWT